MRLDSLTPLAATVPQAALAAGPVPSGAFETTLASAIAPAAPPPMGETTTLPAPAEPSALATAVLDLVAQSPIPGAVAGTASAPDRIAANPAGFEIGSTAALRHGDTPQLPAAADTGKARPGAVGQIAASQPGLLAVPGTPRASPAHRSGIVAVEDRSMVPPGLTPEPDGPHDQASAVAIGPAVSRMAAPNTSVQAEPGVAIHPHIPGRSDPPPVDGRQAARPWSLPGRRPPGDADATVVAMPAGPKPAAGRRGGLARDDADRQAAVSPPPAPLQPPAVPPTTAPRSPPILASTSNSVPDTSAPPVIPGGLATVAASVAASAPQTPSPNVEPITARTSGTPAVALLPPVPTAARRPGLAGLRPAAPLSPPPVLLGVAGRHEPPAPGPWAAPPPAATIAPTEAGLAVSGPASDPDAPESDPNPGLPARGANLPLLEPMAMSARPGPMPTARPEPLLATQPKPAPPSVSPAAPDLAAERQFVPRRQGDLDPTAAPSSGPVSAPAPRALPTNSIGSNQPDRRPRLPSTVVTAGLRPPTAFGPARPLSFADRAEPQTAAAPAAIQLPATLSGNMPPPPPPPQAALPAAPDFSGIAPSPRANPSGEPLNAAMAVASERLGLVRIGLAGGPRDLQLAMTLPNSDAAATLATAAPALVAELASQGVRLDSLTITAVAGPAATTGAPTNMSASGNADTAGAGTDAGGQGTPDRTGGQPGQGATGGQSRPFAQPGARPGLSPLVAGPPMPFAPSTDRYA